MYVMSVRISRGSVVNQNYLSSEQRAQSGQKLCIHSFGRQVDLTR